MGPVRFSRQTNGIRVQSGGTYNLDLHVTGNVLPSPGADSPISVDWPVIGPGVRPGCAWPTSTVQ